MSEDYHELQRYLASYLKDAEGFMTQICYKNGILKTLLISMHLAPRFYYVLNFYCYFHRLS